MNQEKIASFKQLIDSFNTKYYDEENEKLKKEIDNIRMGRPRREGINDLVRSSIVPKNQVEKEVKKLQNRIRDNKENAKKLGNILSQLRISTDMLEGLAEKKELLDSLDRILTFRSSSQIEKTGIFKENREKYKKLYFKSTKKIRHAGIKIGKSIYKLIKNSSGLKAYKRFETYYQSPIGALKDNKTIIKDKYDASNIVFNDTHKNYQRTLKPYSDNLSLLGVQIDKLDYAIEHLKGEPDLYSVTWKGKECLEKLNLISKFKNNNYKIKGGYSVLNELEKKYKEIVELSREIWYVQEVLAAFRNTVITNSEMYIGLQSLVKEQQEELRFLISKADKLYEKSGLQNKVNLVEQLEELFRKTEELKLKIEQYEKNEDYKQADFVKQDYYELRYEMIKILKDNPDLNKTEYNIDIKNIIKKEMELLEPEIKKETKQEKTSHVENIPTRVQTKKEIPVEESVKLESFELDSELQIQRTMHYQNYMKEKVLNSDLSKMPFSVYLESVAPHLTMLINIEKQREKKAETIYKKYIKYYAALENKKDAMSFEEYAQVNYGIGNVDVPIEFEEEYKEMRKI